MTDDDAVDANRELHGYHRVPRAQAGDTPRPMVSRCTAESHAAIRMSAYVFKFCTTGLTVWEGLMTGQCAECQSTLALPMCSLACGEPCPSNDQLPWGGDDRVAHFACAARSMLAKGRTKFVILVGGKTAREFSKG